MNAFVALRLQRLVELYAPLRQRWTLLDGQRASAMTPPAPAVCPADPLAPRTTVPPPQPWEIAL
jgi:hypothetical protein